jgi:putative oxidoreductase
MLVAIWTVTGKNGYWITRDGTEYNMAIIVVAIGVALAGPGTFSVDALIGLY